MATKLFFLILGATVPGRHTEQHDVFFGIGDSLKDLLPQIEKAWPNAKVHIDSWREINTVNGNAVKIIAKTNAVERNNKLFFLNLGGYKPGDMEEYHYKLLAIAKEKGEAVQQAKQTAFYLHTGFKGATSHIDDKYGVDVDDVYQIEDILPQYLKEQFTILIERASNTTEDELHIGYVKLSSLS